MSEIYRQLSSSEVAALLQRISDILLPVVREAQQAGRDWTTIIRQVQADHNDSTQIALHQLDQLSQANRLLDGDEPRIAAGLNQDDMTQLIGLLSYPPTKPKKSHVVEGRLGKNAAGRYIIEGDPNSDHYFNVGDLIELYLYDEQVDGWQWVATYLEYQDGDYYPEAQPNLKLGGVTVRRYSSFG